MGAFCGQGRLVLEKSKGKFGMIKACGSELSVAALLLRGLFSYKF